MGLWRTAAEGPVVVAAAGGICGGVCVGGGGGAKDVSGCGGVDGA